MINDHISDMLTRIKNAYAVGKKTVSLPHTGTCQAIAEVMLTEKYLGAVAVDAPAGAHPRLLLTLSYHDSTPALTELRRISKSGVRIYRPVNKFKPVLSGLGIAILSTPKGIMSDRQARLAHLGGEVLAELW